MPDAVLIVICLIFLIVRQKKTVQISYSLYPFLRNIESIKADVEASWKDIDPSVELKYVEYDCYKDTPDNIGVFFYDVYRESDFISKGFLKSIEKDAVEDTDDILPFALEGVADYGKLYGIPALLCADFLIYDTADPVLSECVSVDDLLECSNKIAADGGNTCNYYLQTLIDRRGNADCVKNPDIAVNLDENAKSGFQFCRKNCLSCTF